LSQVKLSYFQHPARELVNLDSCELVRSQFSLVSDYTAGVALDYLADVSEQLLPPAEPNERWFRLLAAVLDHLQPGGPDRVWCAVTYFTIWAVRLGGFLPEANSRAWQQLSAPSREIAAEMLSKPVGGLGEVAWSRETAADLRRFLVGRIESQVERRLVTAPALENS
jgi:DNA repair protein RecO (recombination protein O)